MFYVVDATSGNRFGPYDRSALRQFLNEGRIQPLTLLVDATTGEQSPVRDVLGLGAPPTASRALDPMTDQLIQFSVSHEHVKKSYQMIFFGLLCCPILPNLYGIYRGLAAVSMGNSRGLLPTILNAGLLLFLCTSGPRLLASLGQILTAGSGID